MKQFENLNIKDYPIEIQKSIERALDDIENKRTVSNSEMKKKYLALTKRTKKA